MPVMMNKERFKVSGDQLVDKFKDLVHQGNVRTVRIIHDGNTIVQFPLTVAVIGTVVAPMVAAVGALAAVLTDCTIEVERHEEESETEGETPQDAVPDIQSNGVGGPPAGP